MVAEGQATGLETFGLLSPVVGVHEYETELQGTDDWNIAVSVTQLPEQTVAALGPTETKQNCAEEIPAKEKNAAVEKNKVKFFMIFGVS